MASGELFAADLAVFAILQRSLGLVSTIISPPVVAFSRGAEGNRALLDVARAKSELGWHPSRSVEKALRELISGLREGAGIETPPPSPHSGGPARSRELLTGVGGREW